MKPISDTGFDYASFLGGTLRATAFLLLILVLTPVQVFYLGRKSADPRRIPYLFHRALVRVLGFKVRVHGHMAAVAQGPVLFVANHASYLDIPVLGSLIPAAFIAKADVRRWPIFGVLARLQQTVFIERRAARASDQRDALRTQIENGRSLILFPEGTSSVGVSVLPFKSSLFGMVEGGFASSVKVQPVSVICTELDGLPITRSWRSIYAWYGDMTLPRHLWNVFKYGRFTVDVVFHPPIFLADFRDRKVLAAYCQKQVARGIEQGVTGRWNAETPKLLAPPKQKLLGA